MTIWWGPGANGSGIAELIGYLNGINYPDVIGFETYVTKTFGVVLAVVGGLCVGKEGPLAHIGANVGAVVAYLPLPRFEWFRNDTYKRNFMAAGCSAGVSAAFGAPVGGALFAFEISKPNTFWKFSVIWKVFLSCAMSVFTLAVVSAGMSGEKIEDVTSAVLKFGNKDIEPPTIEVIPGTIVVGCIAGVLGGMFVIVNSNLGILRKKYITKDWQKILEAAFFSIATTTTFYWMPSLIRDCEPKSEASSDEDIIVQYDCNSNYYNPLATNFFNTEGDAIRSIISGFEGPGGVNSTSWPLFVFFLCWYFFTITTYGVWCPAGLFLPGIIIGCAMGGCYAEVQAKILGENISDTFDSQTSVTFVMVGAGSMLSAYCRLTYSLVVIMLETTSSINIFLPMMIGILCARGVANIFCGSLYDRALRAKQMPFLRANPAEQTRFKPASEIMSKDIVTLSTISNMESCKKALQTKHNAYPVINTAGRLVGLIPKHFVVRILEKKQFYNREAVNTEGSEVALDNENRQIQNAFSLNDNGNAPLLGNGGGDSNVQTDEFALDYDEKNGFPKTPENEHLHYSEFNVDIMSSEADGERVILDVIEENYEEWIDLRPYMIESPQAVSVHDKFYKVLEQFRINHCRHMMVCDPSNGAIKGVITRKDIFAYNGL